MAIVFSELSLKISLFIGMAMLNAISLQMFQMKMKISPQIISMSWAEHLQILKRCTLSAMTSTLVTIVHITRMVLDDAKWIMPRGFWLIKRQSCHHVEINQLIWRANQITGFYIKVFNELIERRKYYESHKSSRF